MNFKIEIFHFLTGPWSLPQKFQTGLNARVFDKTIYMDKFPENSPSKMIDQAIQYGLQVYSVKGVILLFIHLNHIGYHSNKDKR